jgi:hypothetical protein
VVNDPSEPVRLDLTVAHTVAGTLGWVTVRASPVAVTESVVLVDAVALADGDGDAEVATGSQPSLPARYVCAVYCGAWVAVSCGLFATDAYTEPGPVFAYESNRADAQVYVPMSVHGVSCLIAAGR